MGLFLILAGSTLIVAEVLITFIYYWAGHEPTFWEYIDVLVSIALGVCTIFLGANMS